MPRFSVVIPLYNKENYVAQTLDSVLGQTFTDFEVIIVNDVSTDNSLNVAKSYTDERIRIINHSINKGLSASRNTGIRNAKAGLIAFIDADDLWSPSFLEEIYELTIKYSEAEIFATNYNFIYPGDIKIEYPSDLKTGIIANFFKSNTLHIYCYSGVCFKTEIFQKAGFFDEAITMGEDIDFNIRTNLISKLAYCNKVLVTITAQSENQITHSSLKGKVIVDHDKYERENPRNKELKRYLDFHRYTMAKRYKMAGEIGAYRALKNAINPANLNWKQRFLLLAPAFILQWIKTAKKLLAKKGYNPTTY